MRSLDHRIMALLLCLVCLTGIRAAAAPDVPSEPASTEEESSVVLTEAEETCDVRMDEVQAYFRRLGTMDGYEVWLRPEDYREVIKADHTAGDAEDILSRCKEAELVLTKGNAVTACLEETTLGSGQHSYLSTAGRYLVILDAEQQTVERIRYRVSTLDSPCLFLTQDKQTLELYNTDYSELRETMTPDGRESGGLAYRSADGTRLAILSEDCDEAWVCVKQAAENDRFVLYYDEDTAVIGLKNKENGYIWWSSPLRSNRDAHAKALTMTELGSSLVLTYGNRNAYSTSTQRSRDGAVLTCTAQPDGVKISYRFAKSGITVPVSYTLCEDYLSVSVETSEIKEEKTEEGLIATSLTLLGAFGAGDDREDGYFVIPDGCGALVHFHNGKDSAKNYSARVYGRDLTMVPDSKPAVTETVLLPVYGIVKEGNAMTVIAEQGDSVASVNASVQSLSSYSLCNFSFLLRDSDSYQMAGDSGNTITVFENGSIRTPSLKLRYYPTAAEGADYADVAETYRAYLLGDGGVTAHPDEVQLSLSLYGGTMKTRSILGFPIRMKTAVTTYDEAAEIVGELSDGGVDRMSVIYHQWTNAGITGKVDRKASPSGMLGGKKGFTRLQDCLEEKGFSLYPAVNNTVFRSGNGYYPFLHTAIRISGAYARILPYRLSYGVQDTSKKTESLLSPSVFGNVYASLAKSYAGQELTGVCPGDMTSALWGDYGKRSMGREDARQAVQQSCGTITDAGLSLLSDGCAAYALPYTDRIADAPMQSSGFDLFDEDVPFYQMVLHGVIPFAGTPLNAGSDADAAFLEAIAFGCEPSFTMIHAEAGDLKDTSLDGLYYAHYSYWTDTAARMYRMADEILSGVSGQNMTAYTREGDRSVTTYADGTRIEVDYAAQTVTSGETVWTLTEEGGTT